MEEIKKWQAERTALEEEILVFDGGDLTRMKQKTRGEPDSNLRSNGSCYALTFDPAFHPPRLNHSGADRARRPSDEASAAPGGSTRIDFAATSMG